MTLGRKPQIEAFDSSYGESYAGQSKFSCPALPALFSINILLITLASKQLKSRNRAPRLEYVKHVAATVRVTVSVLDVALFMLP